MTTQNNDPYAAAMNAEENTSRTYFGQITVDSWFCVLEKGVGKRPFDPNTDKVQDRKTCIQMFLQPVSVARFNDVIQRDMIAEFGKDWLKIARPSLAAIGHDLRSIHMQWVEVEMVQHGTYTNKSGEEKPLTAFRFVRTFASEADADTAYAAHYSGGAQTPAAGSFNADGTPTNGGNGGDKQREVAAKFLAPLWKSAGGDLDKFQTMIASNPVTKRFFTITSPEVMALVAPEAVF
jgi:hypothetical protein